MKVVLDTNILDRDPFFKNTDMQKLINLAKKGIIELIIPDVVWEEYKTKINDEYSKSFSEYEKKLKSTYDKTVCNSEKKILEKGLESLQESKKQLFAAFEERLNDFIDNTNLQIIQNNGDEKEMFKMYFSGTAPFKGIKSRDDIPDCFIFLAIKKIDNPYVICNDRRLKAALDSINIKTFNTIDDFLEDKKAELIKTEKEQLINSIYDYINENELQITRIMSPLLEDELEYKVIYDEMIMDDNNEGTIDGRPTISDIQLDKATLKYSGNDFFSIDFQCNFDSLIEYYIFKSDFFCLDEEEIAGIWTEDWNDHYFLAEEEMNINCRGTVSIKVNFEDNDFCFDNYLITKEDISFDNIELSVNRNDLN